MARDEESEGGAEKARRQVGRSVANTLVVLISLAVIFGWAYSGLYQLEPGEAGVILRLGKFHRTQPEPGLRWHLPPPLEEVERVNITEVLREKFGLAEGDRSMEPGETTASADNAIQTADSNIVNLSYEVQYTVEDAFAFLFAMAAPQETLRDAAQASVREVVGRTSVDGVLSSERAKIESESMEILQATLDSYFSNEGRPTGFDIDKINLNVVQPPPPVQEAFDDVIAAQQDAAGLISEAQGDLKEILERAGAEAQEKLSAANAYKDSKILEANGEAQRFVALQTEYARAPEVTRRRLYLETMEEVMPRVEKVIVEPDAVQLLPFLPYGPGAGSAPAPSGGGKGER